MKKNNKKTTTTKNKKTTTEKKQLNKQTKIKQNKNKQKQNKKNKKKRHIKALQQLHDTPPLCLFLLLHILQHKKYQCYYQIWSNPPIILQYIEHKHYS